MTDLLIRDLAVETHEELKRRADQAGMSVQAYVTQLLERSTAAPSLDEWLNDLDGLPRHREITGADAVRDELRTASLPATPCMSRRPKRSRPGC